MNLDATHQAISKIDRACQSVQRENVTPQQRATAMRYVLRRSIELATLKDGLVTDIESGWTFVDDHPGRADVAELEDQVIAWITIYEQSEDALERAASVVRSVDDISPKRHPGRVA